MGLNDFVSLFYGSAQNLNAPSSTSTSSLFLSTSANTTSATSTDVVVGKSVLKATFSETASATLEMLKNHKNSKLPKFHLNDYPSTNDVKFSRNMTLTTMKTPRQKGIILSGANNDDDGNGGENYDNICASASVCGGKSGRKKKNATLNSSSASLHKLHSSSTASLQAATAAATHTPTNAKGTLATLDAISVSTITDTSTSSLTKGKTKTSAGTTQSSNEMDILKVPGLRKKSSFLWNSFRMPRKQKGVGTGAVAGGSGGGESRA